MGNAKRSKAFHVKVVMMRITPSNRDIAFRAVMGLSAGNHNLFQIISKTSGVMVYTNKSNSMSIHILVYIRST